MPTRRLYRVTADYGNYEQVKHFQTYRAALAHAAKCLQGYVVNRGSVDDETTVGPALSASIDRSNPITFPES